LYCHYNSFFKIVFDLTDPLTPKHGEYNGKVFKNMLFETLFFKSLHVNGPLIGCFYR